MKRCQPTHRLTLIILSQLIATTDRLDPITAALQIAQDRSADISFRGSRHSTDITHNASQKVERHWSELPHGRQRTETQPVAQRNGGGDVCNRRLRPLPLKLSLSEGFVDARRPRGPPRGAQGIGRPPHPLTRLCGSPELYRLRPALRAHLTDLAYLSECAAYQYPRAANGRDLALVLRASAVLRSFDAASGSWSLAWHMAQMFSVLSPPTATTTIYDTHPAHLHAFGLEIAPPTPSLGLGIRVEFLSPHQWPTPVPVPADNGDMIAARTAIRAYTSARGVLPTVWEGAYFPWLLTHVLPPTASLAEGEAGALASLRVASRLTTRLYAAVRRNPQRTPIPPVLSRCYALVAIGNIWTLYAGVLEGDLMVSEITTVNAADPEGLMAALSLVRVIASEAEARRTVLENWLWCLDPPSPLSSSSGSLPVTPDSASNERYENPRRAPLPEKAFENPRAAPKTPSPPNSQSQIPLQAPPRPAARRIPIPFPPSTGGSSPPTSPKDKRMGVVSPTSPVAIPKGRSPILDVRAWRQAVRRPSGTLARPSGFHKLSKSVG